MNVDQAVIHYQTVESKAPIRGKRLALPEAD